MLWVLIRSASACGYSLEAPRRGASNEYPQHMFSLRNEKNTDTFWLKESTLSRAMPSGTKASARMMMMMMVWCFLRPFQHYLCHIKTTEG